MLEPKIIADVMGVEELAKKYPGASREARISKLTEAVNLLERAIKKETPYGAGPIHLRDSIFGDVKASGRKVIGIVGTPLAHGEPVEKGTKPHFPPIGPIQFWVEKKLGYAGAEAASVAFLIARAISVRGTKGARMFERGFEDNEARILKILEEIPEDIIRRVS